MTSTDARTIERAKGSFPLLLVLGLLILAASFMVGWFAGDQLGALRADHMNEGRAPETYVATEGSIFYSMYFGVGGLIVLLGLIPWHARQREALRESGKFAGAPGIAITLIGLAGGIAWTMPNWLPPVTEGFRSGFRGGEFAWDWLDWGLFYLKPWLPVALAALGVIGFLLGLRRGGGGENQRQLLDRLLVDAPRVVGYVTEADSSPAAHGKYSYEDFGVTYMDHNGKQHSISHTLLIQGDDRPAVGQRVTVMYDPEQPSNSDHVFWGSEGAQTPADFTRWAPL